MSDDLQQLRMALQMLALPVLGQVRLVDDDRTRTMVLAEAFSAAHQAVPWHVGKQLIPEQTRVLVQLDDHLARLHGESSVPVCSELAMRSSSDWRQVRSLAREALVHFRWTLDVPPQALLPATHHSGSRF